MNLENNNELLREQKKWQSLFPSDLLAKGKSFYKLHHITEFSAEDSIATAVVQTTPNYRYSVRIAAPSSYSEDWDASRMFCSCRTKKKHTIRRGGTWRTQEVCAHMAAVLVHWEKLHGPWILEETPEERDIRLEEEKKKREAEERERLRREKRRRIKDGTALLDRGQAEKKKTHFPAVSLFPRPLPAGTCYNLNKALESMVTNRYAADRAGLFLRENAAELRETSLGFASNGSPMLSAEGSVEDFDDVYQVKINLLSEPSVICRCSCTPYYYYIPLHADLCEHSLAVLSVLWDYIRRENPGDITDRAASDFLQAMDDLSGSQETATEETPRAKTVSLRPRLQLEDGSLSMAYTLGYAGGRPLVLRGYRNFLSAYAGHGTFQLSKTVSLDFSQEDLTDESQPWLTFLQRRLSDADLATDSLHGYSSVEVKTWDRLSGAVLDRFYELADGTSVEMSQRGSKTGLPLRIGHTKLLVPLSTARVTSDGGLTGIEITGTMPVILSGSAGNYMLTPDCMSRLTREENRALLPFRNASDSSGSIRLRIGRDKLAEYYYRVVPQLRQNPFIDLEDDCAEEVETILPPEPRFTFRLDIDRILGFITCDAMVRYGDRPPHSLPYPPALESQRDAVQEERVLTAVRSIFPRCLEGQSLHLIGYDEDVLYDILTKGIPELSRYGTVEGSSAFEKSSLRPMPQIRIGVSIESSLLEIDVLTKDMPPEELLAVLESYRQKKRYHRLTDGGFIRLENDAQLAELSSMGDGMDFSLEDAVRGGARVPMYRALYLDSLLEEHNALSSNRERTYRALLKNFRTIRDADYEVPDAQAEILRPYQVYGYKWLRTLSAAGFGGILADEMGLGKTLQFISLVQALRDEGSMSLGLVVCPASLVYNWYEEFQRFAPGLAAQVMTGTAALRRSRFAGLADGTVCITSYDLLRQDIAFYKELDFSVTVLDEAQYIKNQKAALTKAVKVIRSRLRFALTGTPIENRLSELWSIFDFLMPGFLYGYTEFSRRLETPIVKQQDPAATARLKQMTSPFILRRLKSDVLKDLPPKLEEVRYTRFDDEQRKIYDGQVVRIKQLLTNSSSGENKIHIFAELTRLRQICCDPSLILEGYKDRSAKRAACLELIQTAMGGGHRMLVFSQFTSMLALLEQDLAGEGIPYFKLTGSTSKEQRLRLVREFNEGDTPVFLISLKAGGTGLNLTGADVVIHYDPWWNLAVQNQATDRAHRIGQENQVTVYRIIVKDTIEERILALQEAKHDLAEAVLSGESQSLASLSNEELLALLS